MGTVLEKLRVVLKGDSTTQPYVITGSGGLGWEVIVANFTERGDKALVLNTGYFSDAYALCCDTYGLDVHQIYAGIGDVVDENQLIAALQKQQYKLICITQVDTSTGVLNDVQRYSQIVRQYQPSALVTVDGVCSFAGEVFEFSEWDIDCAMSCTQKALGCPPGLAVGLFSQRAIDVFKQRTTPVPSYYSSLTNWLPILTAYEQRKPSYFATPNVNLVAAFNTSLSLLIENDIDKVVQKHQVSSKKFRAALEALHLRLIPTSLAHTANTVSAIWYPSADEEPSFNKDVFLATATKNGIVLAAGLHKKIKTDCFRVGTMGYSVWNKDGREDVRTAVQLIEKTLIECGAKNIQKGNALKAYDSA